MLGLFASPAVAVLAAAVVTVLFPSSARAQVPDQHSFAFKFASATFTDIVQCETMHFSIIPVNTSTQYLGAPPYQVYTFEAGGIHDVQDGGSNPLDIPWQIRHSPGARLFVTIVDANGDIGGFPLGYYTVLAGSTTSCMPKPLPADQIPRLSANVSNVDLHTCQPWGMTVEGGTPPYTVFIVADNSPVYTNTSSPADSTTANRFTYINRADPERTMIVAVADANGVAGIATQPVFTKGNTDTTCTGLISSWRAAAAVQKEMEDAQRAAEAEAANRRRTTIIIAVAAVLGFILLCGVAFFIWRKVASRSVKKGQPGFDMEPVTAYFPPPGGETSTASGGIITTRSMRQASLARQPSGEASFVSSRPLMRQPSAVSGVGSTFSYSQRDELPPLPTDYDPYMLAQASGSSPPRSRKGEEAAAERRAALMREQSSASASHVQHYRAGSGGPPSVGSPSVNGTGGASVVGTDDDGAIIVQHRDGGAPPVVLELPPAYDHSRRISAMRSHGRDSALHDHDRIKR